MIAKPKKYFMPPLFLIEPVGEFFNQNKINKGINITGAFTVTAGIPTMLVRSNHFQYYRYQLQWYHFSDHFSLGNRTEMYIEIYKNYWKISQFTIIHFMIFISINFDNCH